MALPRWWARANRVTVNPLARHLARRAPGMGVLTHTGRRTGASYDTPLIVFDRPGGWIVALPYGERADWVRNVLAAGAAGLHTRRHLVPVTDPKITNHRRHPGLPWLFRQTFAVTGVHTFLELTTAPDRPDR